MSDSAVESDTGSKTNDSDVAESAKSRRTWVQPLADVIRLSDPAVEPLMQTTLTCDNKPGVPALYLPQDTDEKHPRSIRYIRSFAKANGFKLGRDRRDRQVQPISERRSRKPPMIALGLSLLLKQTGLPGTARTLSKPHTLAPGSESIPLGKLIRMAALTTPDSKRVVVLPNRILINTLQDTQPICGHACKLHYSGKTTVLSHFDSPYFRAIGYSSGSQYVVHVCLAGGPRGKSSLWTQIPTLTNIDFNFQLFPGQQAVDDFGLFYITFYLNLSDGPSPWWLDDKSTIDTHISTQEPAEAEPQRKAS